MPDFRIPDTGALMDIEAVVAREPTLSQRHLDELCRATHMLRVSVATDPAHERARAAIKRLGLDGSRLELAVAVFGWGSDEANGSLLGLVRTAWGAEHVEVAQDGMATVWRVEDDADHGPSQTGYSFSDLVTASESAP